jgi:CHAT domain-containing protein
MRHLKPLKLRLTVTVLLATALFTSISAHAQNLGVAEFDRAADKHKREVETLLENKAAPRPSFPEGTLNHQSVTAALKPFPTGTALLFYDYSEPDQLLQVWLLNPNGIRRYVAIKQKREELEKSIATLRQALGVENLQVTRTPRRLDRARVAYSPTPTSPRLLESSVNNLSEILLPPPIRPELQSVKHLIVVTTGAIGTVPLSVLQPFKKDRYLIEDMSISYAPSLYELVREVRPWKHELLPAVIVGDPDLTSIKGWEFPTLTGAKKEANAVAELLKTQPLIGKDANMETVLSKVQGAKLLYFATHGVADSEASVDNSFLALGSQRPGYGMWTMRQIEARYYDETELAVLSACQTGLGQVYDGGIMHLARTFQVSGVPRVVMSLWRVDDEATADLMITFMRHLQDTSSNVIPAEALRRAMIEVKGRRPEPRRWASFVLFGTPR